jgi:synaptojanin
MAGARFISRGIDDSSNVANFVETELIVTYDQHMYSFVQIRGSIPLFWEQKQKGLVSHISIKRNEDLTSQAFDGHLNDLTSSYTRVVMVNLVRKSKQDEDKLLQALLRQLQSQPNKNVKHKWFDFHGETHGDNFHKVNSLM